MFGALHAPLNTRASGVGILFCPPFGWNEICAHRGYMHWAELLADHGHHALRIDLPGSGESSGGPRDPGQLDAWRAGVNAGASVLATQEGCRRVVGLGIGLGGMLACLAAADGAPIDDLLLWAVPSRGGGLLRELRVFARVADSEIRLPDGGEPPPPADGSLEVAGFLLTPETIGSLEALDLTEHELPSGAERHALLLGRDVVPVDRRLREHLEASATVTTGAGGGYAALMVHPELTAMPEETFATSLAWLERLPRSAAAPRPTRGPASSDGALIAIGPTSLRESAFELEGEGGVMRGTLVEPSASEADRPRLCVVLPNSGAVRRIGPSRMWVEASRRWASLGVSTLRVDLLAIGDGDGDERVFRWPGAFYGPERTQQLLAVLDALAERGIADRFVLCGLCSGTFWSYGAAQADPRVCSTMLINPWWFEFHDAVPLSRYARLTIELMRAGDVREIMRLVRSEDRAARAARALGTRLRGVVRGRAQAPAMDATELAFAALRERGVRTLLLLGYREALEETLTAAGRIDQREPYPGVTLERIPVADHTFRPVWAQRFVHEALDRWLELTIVAERR
jgi:pimeloyl-ACP methyl ester carboxylesterase